MADFDNQLVVYSGGKIKKIAANDVVQLDNLKIDTQLTLAGVNVTSTATELNILDGVTATTAELNILDGVTSTATELNLLDGVTSTTAELNLVDGSSAGTIVNSKAVIYGSSGEVNATTLQIGGSSITSTPAELNLVDGSVAGTIVNSKAVVYGSSGEVNATTLQIGGSSITATAAEINYLDITTLGTSENSKALTQSSGGVVTIGASNGDQVLDIASHDLVDGGLKLAGTLVTASAAEINALDGATSDNTTNGKVAIVGTSGDLKVHRNLTITGNLTVNGTTTTVNSTTVTIDDPIFTLGGDTAPSSDDNKDRGIEFRYHDGTSAKIGFMGWDDSAEGFTLLNAATNSSDVFSGTASDLVIGGLTTSGITIGSTLITSTAAELNVMDGDTSATSTTLADDDRVVVNDDDVGMKQVALTDFETYFESALDTLSNVTTVGALNAGSITSGFGSIDNGSSAITTTGTVTFGSLSDTSITITGFVDEDNMNSDSATLIPTQQSVKAYVDSQVQSGSSDATSGAVSNSGNVLITSNSDNSGNNDQISLKVGTNNTVVEVKNDRVDVNKHLVLNSGGAVSLKPAASTAIGVGSIVGFKAEGSTDSGIAPADADVGTNYLKTPIGVALEASGSSSVDEILVNTIPGSLVEVLYQETSGSFDVGEVVYLSDTTSAKDSLFGCVTKTPPSINDSGLSYQIGFVAEYISDISLSQNADGLVKIIWMPQFIADLG